MIGCNYFTVTHIAASQFPLEKQVYHDSITWWDMTPLKSLHIDIEIRNLPGGHFTSAQTHVAGAIRYNYDRYVYKSSHFRHIHFG